MIRADCIDGPRPCPWVGCRYHLALEVVDDTLYNRHNSSRLHGNEYHADFFAEGVVETLGRMAETCELDVAEWGGASLSEVGDLISLGKTWTYESSEEALALVRALIEEGKAK